MIYFPEDYIAKLSKNRLTCIRRKILTHINQSEKCGHWCCELKCEWIADGTKEYSTEDRNRDYAYRDLINKYYDRVK